MYKLSMKKLTNIPSEIKGIRKRVLLDSVNVNVI
jgi:hypothetical protein